MVDRSVEVRLRLDISNFDSRARAAQQRVAGLDRDLAALDVTTRRYGDTVEDSSRRVALNNQSLSDYRRNARLAGNANQRLTQSFVDLNNQTGTASAGMTLLTGRQNDVSQSSRRLGNDVDRLSGRVGIAVDGVLALGAGLIPIGAVGVQALGGLATAAAAAGTAGLTAVVAFQGVGDAVKAVEAYRLEPTAANLEKARDAVSQLGPDAREFVAAFQEARPMFRDMRDAAASGLFPGLSQALDDLDRVAPKIERILEATGQATGDVIADGVDSLGGKRWDEFFDFLAVEMPAATRSLGSIFGDLAHGVSELWMAMDPGNDRFLGWAEDVSDTFDDWASSAEGADAITDILEYARRNGPAVGDFFNSLVQATAAIVKAAAPLGGPVLTGLTAAANLIEAIAESDMATPILAGAAAFRIWKRAADAAASTRVENFLSPFRGAQTVTASRSQQAAMSGLPAGTQAALLAPRPGAVAASRAAAAANAGKAAALVGMIGLATSGLADDMGVANTASLALMGTMIAPGWGTAAGAITGYLLDMRSGSSDLVDTLDTTQAAIDSLDFSRMGAGLQEAGSQLEDYRRRVTPIDSSKDFWGSLGQTFDPAYMGNAIEGIFGKSELQERDEEYARLGDRAATAQEAVAGLGTALGGTVGELDGSARSTAELNDILDRAAPTMDRLGISAEQLARSLATKKAAEAPGASLLAQIGQDRLAAMGEDYDTLSRRLARGIRIDDSDIGRMRSVTDVITEQGTEMLTTAEAADELRSALDALFSPQMDLTAATDAWTTSLRTLNDDLADNRTLVGDSNAAIANRAAIQQRIRDLTDVLVADFGKNRDGARVAELFKDGRRELLKFGEAADISGDQLKAFLRGQGLTWNRVKQTVQAGAEAVEQNMERLRSSYDKLPRRLVSDVVANGIPKTIGDVDRLVARYHLTEEQREALLTVKDLATGRTEAVIRALKELGQERPRPTVSVEDQASGKLQGILGLLREAAQDRSSTIHVTTVYSQMGRPGARPGADGGTIGPDGRIYLGAGGTVPGVRWPYGDKVDTRLAPGEEVVSNRFGQADANRPLLRAISSLRGPIRLMADGGTAGSGSSEKKNTPDWSMPDNWVTPEMQRLRNALRELRGEVRENDKALAASTRTLDKERALRDRMVGFRDTVGSSVSAAELTGNGLAGFDLGLRANRNDTRSADRSLNRAENRGLDGALYNFIAQSGDLNLIEQFSRLSRKEIERRERMFGSMNRAQDAFGDRAVMERFGESIAHQGRDIDRFASAVDRFEDTGRRQDKRIRELERALERATERGAREGTRRGAAEGARGRDVALAGATRRGR